MSVCVCVCVCVVRVWEGVVGLVVVGVVGGVFVIAV